MSTALKIITVMRRYVVARRLGFLFVRSKGFTPPKQIKIGGALHSFQVPKDPGAFAAFVGILLDDEYGVARLRLPATVARVVDIGGHAGFFSLSVLSRFSIGSLDVYEPNPSVFEIMRSNLAWAGANTIPKAVGLKGGRVSVEASFGDSLSATCTQDEHGKSEMAAWDEVLKGSTVDLVKMDCEGHEWPILQDSGSMSQVNALLLEYHPRNGMGLDDVRACLSRDGLNIERHVGTAGGCGIVTAYRRAG